VPLFTLRSSITDRADRDKQAGTFSLVTFDRIIKVWALVLATLAVAALLVIAYEQTTDEPDRRPSSSLRD
jgi:hypothetical protein